MQHGQGRVVLDLGVCAGSVRCASVCPRAPCVCRGAQPVCTHTHGSALLTIITMYLPLCISRIRYLYSSRVCHALH